MTVVELIAQLRKFPADTPVGYVNACAEDGAQFISVDYADMKTRAQERIGAHPGLPERGAVVLS